MHFFANFHYYKACTQDVYHVMGTELNRISRVGRVMLKLCKNLAMSNFCMDSQMFEAMLVGTGSL